MSKTIILLGLFAVAAQFQVVRPGKCATWILPFGFVFFLGLSPLTEATVSVSLPSNSKSSLWLPSEGQYEYGSYNIFTLKDN